MVAARQRRTRAVILRTTPTGGPDMSMPLSASSSPVDDAGGGPPRTSQRRVGARRRLLLVLAGCLVAIVFGPLSSAQAATASITGTVTAVKGGGDLKGIEVVVKSEGGTTVGSATTAANGKYTVSALAEGEYTVVFDDPSETYLSQEHTVTLEEGKALTLNATLKEGGLVTGTVTSAATGAGLEGVEVFIEGEDEFYDTTTEAGGHYVIRDVAPGTDSIEFAGSSAYLFQSVTRSIGEGTVEVNVALVEGAKISGTVTDAVSHAGLAKIAVYAYSSSGEYAGYASTNSSGEYTLTGLEGGSYKLEFLWEFSEAEEKEFEGAARAIPKYVTQYYNGQVSLSSANAVEVGAGATTSGINVAMVPSSPVNTALPVISGTSTVGSVLSCSTGSWTGEPELTLSAGWPLTSPFAFQWLRNGVGISGASSDAYVVQAADVGQGLVCEVTATNAAGKATAKSSSFTVVPPVPVIKITTSKLSVSKNATKVGISCTSAACAGTVKAIETVITKHHKGHRTIVKKEKIVVASGSYSLAAGQSEMVTLHLTGIGKSKLAKAPHHHLAVKLVASLTGGKQLVEAARLAGH